MASGSPLLPDRQTPQLDVSRDGIVSHQLVIVLLLLNGGSVVTPRGVKVLAPPDASTIGGSAHSAAQGPTEATPGIHPATWVKSFLHRSFLKTTTVEKATECGKKV